MGIYSLEKALSQAKFYYRRDADPWDIVSLFEEKIARFAGSKYAVALDSCTNALFLCLKYLKIQNREIEIPSRKEYRERVQGYAKLIQKNSNV